MSREEFGRSIQYLSQIELIYYEVDGCKTGYRHGFLAGFTYWQLGAYEKLPPDDWSSFDPQAGFRRAVNTYQDTAAENSEWERGYEDAIILFREAKGL